MQKENNNYRELIKSQILEIRDSGATNMFNTKAVQHLANEQGFYELVCYIEEHSGDYCKFIICGDDDLLPNHP